MAHDSQPSFLARTSLLGFLPERWRLPNYLAIILAVVFVVPFLTRGARLALETNTNDARDWLPPDYRESKELKWFQGHFVGEQFALVSWDGCTLGNPQKLQLLARKLTSANPQQSYFHEVITGPGVIDQLTGPPLNLSYREAIERLEGSLVGPDLTGEGDESRVTCLVVTLNPKTTATNKAKAAAIDTIVRAARQCAIEPDALHMGGPPVDNVAIDKEGQRTLVRLAALAGITGIVLSYLCFRSVRLTMMIFAVGVLSAALSLAVVFYYGMAEVYLLGMAYPRIGTVDAILMSMPAVVYVLGLSSSIHIVNYFRDARREQGLSGAAEMAIRHGWKPCVLAALTTAVGLASLYTSDITPIRKFGVYSAVGVVGTLALLFTLLPAVLHRFPPKAPDDEEGEDSVSAHHPHLARWGYRIGSFIIHRNGLVLAATLLVFVGTGIGLTKIKTSVQLLKLFDEEADIIHDYAWLERHLGNLVPMEIVLRVNDDLLRQTGEDAEADGEHYRLDMLERMQLVARVQERIEGLSEVGRTLSAATFAPALPEVEASLGRGFGLDARRVVGGQLEKHRDELVAGDYLRDEILNYGNPPGAELWRISARLGALDEIDYGQFVAQIRGVVEPVLELYRRRDELVQRLHAQEKQLRLARVTVLYHDPEGTFAQEAEQHAGLFLGKLLREAGARVTYFNIAKIPDGERREAAIEQVQNALQKQDAVVLAAPSAEEAERLAAQAPLTLNLEKSAPAGEPPRETVAAVYTGLVPLVYKTQRQLLISLQESIAWATVLIAVVMMAVMRSLPAGLVAMVPNLFPVIVVFGALGWLGIKVDIGIMMTASVALGVAVDDTVHFWTWFRDALDEGLERKAAVMAAYERCALAMFQTTVVGGLGLFVFATSTFTPTQQFGYLMVTLLSAALIGDLIVLPALLSSRMGVFFRSAVPATDADPHAPAGPPSTAHSHMRRDLPHGSRK